MHDRLPPKGMCSASRDLFNFWETTDDISVQDRNTATMENWYEITCSLSNDTSTSDLQWRWRSLLLSETFLTPIPRKMYLQVIRIAKTACNFELSYWTEGLFKVTGSHIYGKRGNNSEKVRSLHFVETLLLQITNNKWYTAIVAISLTLSDPEAHASNEAFQNATFRNLCSSWQYFNW